MRTSLKLLHGQNKVCHPGRPGNSYEIISIDIIFIRIVKFQLQPCRLHWIRRRWREDHVMRGTCTLSTNLLIKCKKNKTKPKKYENNFDVGEFFINLFL